MFERRTLNEFGFMNPEMLNDFRILGISSVEDLRGQNARELYDRLCRKKEQKQNPELIVHFEEAISKAELFHG